ncbi:MAG: sulfite exporter TauE/SafE family protein [Candidatus Dojkabacteria bacterium]
MEDKNTTTCELAIDGMHCAACEILLEKKISKIKGVKSVDASLSNNKVKLKLDKDFDEKDLKSEINKLINDDGYSVNSGNKVNQSSAKEYIIAIIVSLVFVMVFLLIQKAGLEGLDFGGISYPVVFVIGIIASLSTCMAVTGGLVLTMSSQYAQGSKTKPIIAFHISRIIAFFLLGGVIGILGATFKLTPFLNFIIDLLLFVTMILIGINLLGIFPSLNRFQLHLPKFLGREVVKTSENKSFLAPVLLGIVTFFLPCGFTQSMQLYSLSTGNFLTGALIMFVFALGTLPILGLISFASVTFSKSLQSGLFFKIAGILVLFFAIFNLLSSLVLLGILPPFFNV